MRLLSLLCLLTLPWNPNNMTSLNNTNDEVDSLDYRTLGNKLTDLKSILDDNAENTMASRKLRYAEVDIEVEREAGRIQPDEVYIPAHIIDTNIRREQPAYIQYLVQSPRAVICRDATDPTIDCSLLERDLTDKLRYKDWQLPMFANVDNFQANGYGIMEVVQDKSTPGEIATEQVQASDIAFVSDTRDIQACEMVARTYHYTKTKLLSMCGDPLAPTPEDWSREQVEKVVDKNSQASVAESDMPAEQKDKSLYRIQKVMKRVKGVVHVGWACIGTGDNWLRAPRPLYIGRRRVTGPPQQQGMPPQSVDQYETSYPYFLFQYLISENDTITQLKGRVYLDQDVQEAVTSLTSSLITKARRSAGMYFSKDVSDPNDDILIDNNVFFKPNCLINSKVQAFELAPPESGLFSAVQLLVSGNQQETSQVNFAENNNQRDSRKTATAIKESSSQRQQLTTVQVVLFSQSLTSMYNAMCSVITSRVLAGLIQVNPQVMPLYQRKSIIIKPSGDIDVIEKQQLIQAMQAAWPVIEQTAAAPLFMADMLEKMFPEKASMYIQAIQQDMQQKNSQQAQQMQQLKAFAMQMGKGIVELSKHNDWFSEIGIAHAMPVIEQYANKVLELQKEMGAK